MGRCEAVDCRNSNKDGFKMYRFPREQRRKKIWVQNCRNDRWEPNYNSVLCEVHFDSSQFEQNRSDGCKKLKPNAIPALFAVPHASKLFANSKTYLHKKKREEPEDAVKEVVVELFDEDGDDDEDISSKTMSDYKIVDEDYVLKLKNESSPVASAVEDKAIREVKCEEYPNNESSPAVDSVVREIESEECQARSPSIKRSKIDLRLQDIENINIKGLDHPQSVLDEFQIFGTFVSVQLRNLPPKEAILAQNEIHSILSRYRLKNIPKRC